MEEQDRLCCLTLDEMEIQKAVEYDPSSRQVLGSVTFPGGSGDANHALVFMLGGMFFVYATKSQVFCDCYHERLCCITTGKTKMQ
jgi:hypothetical protein